MFSYLLKNVMNTLALAFPESYHSHSSIVESEFTCSWDFEKFHFITGRDDVSQQLKNVMLVIG
jgi:hypothetical protein